MPDEDEELADWAVSGEEEAELDELDVDEIRGWWDDEDDGDDEEGFGWW